MEAITERLWTFGKSPPSPAVHVHFLICKMGVRVAATPLGEMVTSEWDHRVEGLEPVITVLDMTPLPREAPRKTSKQEGDRFVHLFTGFSSSMSRLQQGAAQAFPVH